MKPVYMGIKTTIINGNEIDSKLFCCDIAIEEIKRLRQLREYIKAINDFFNPKGFIIVDSKPLKYNHCPHCGNKIKEKT